MDSKTESFQRNRTEGKFCRKCVWHFCLQPALVGCEYHLCNDHGRGHPGGEGCPKFLKGNPKIRQGMIDPSERNVRIKLGLDAPKRKAPPAGKTPSITGEAMGDAAAPRPYRPGGKWPPRCWIPERVPMSRKGADLDRAVFLELLRDRGGLYGMADFRSE